VLPVPDALVHDPFDPTSRVFQRRWWTLAVLCCSLVLTGLDNTILNTALPRLVSELGATNSQLQWIVDSYTLVFAGLLLAAGSLGDRFGRRVPGRSGLPSSVSAPR
jgi:MFS family permease